MLPISSLKNVKNCSRRRAVIQSAIQPLEQRVLLSTVSIASAATSEGGPLLFTVSLDSAASAPITVNYATKNKTAKAGVNYAASKGTLTFAAGQSSQTLNIGTMDDGTYNVPLTMDVKLSKATKGNAISPNTAVGTINNIDAAPVLSVSNPAPIPAFAKGSKTMSFTISESGKSVAPVSVHYSTQDISAVAGTDYVAKSGTAKFSKNKTSFAVKVKIDKDASLTSDKDFELLLSSPSNATLASTPYGIGVIGTTGTTSGASLSANSITAAPGGTAAITVNLFEPAADPVTVQYATSNGTATAGTDYTAASGTLTFPVGATSETIDVPILAASAGGTFGVTLSNPTNASLIPGMTTVTIEPTVSVSNVTLPESPSGTTTGNIAVNLSTPSSVPITVNYATSDGTAVAGTNYTAATGTVTIPANSTSANIPITILGGITTSGTFTITLSSANGAVLGAATATATIANPATLPSVSINNPTVDQATSGTTTANFTLTLSAPSTLPVQVTYATADGTAIAGTNYTAETGTITIPAGATSAQIQIPVLGGVTSSADFTINLSAPQNVVVATPSGTATITNTATSLPSLAISDLSVDEASSGTTTANFTVTLSASSTQTVTVSYATADGTAVSTGTSPNYTAQSGTLTFTPGTVTQQISVPILGGVSSTAAFTLTITSPLNATISKASATGTIVNAAADLPTLSIADVSQDEGTGANSTFDFPVTLSAASSSVVTVNYATADAGGSGSATGIASGSNNPNGDYYTASGTLTFLPGTLSENIDVTVIGDTTVEPDETFTVTLSGPGNANLGRSVATGTIVNDDTANPSVPAIAVNDASVAQVANGTATAQFLVSLTAAAAQDVTFNYSTADGTATSSGGNANYTAESGTATIPAGQTSVAIDIPILDDTAMTAPSANFTLNLSSPSANATLANTTATGTIYDNNGIRYGSSTGFAGTTTNGVTSYTFNYSIASTRADNIGDAQIQFFLTNQGQSLDNATPFRVSDVGAVNAGQTVTGSIDLSGAPMIQSGMVYSARLISTTGTVTIVYDLNTLDLIQEPG